jgi:hypothetical protein
MKMILFVVIVLAVCGLATLLVFHGCEDTIKAEAKSPDGKYTATIYERDCGATTDFSTILNLRESSAKFNGDALGPIVVKSQHTIDIVWDGNTRLRLQCNDCQPEQIFKEEMRWKNVEISLGR